jgi:TonB family protein
MRSTLVVTSVGFHIAVVAAFFVAGAWKLERLDRGRQPIDLAVAPSPPPPAPSGSPAAAVSEPFKKKPRTVTKALVQPTRVDRDVTPATASAALDAVGTGGTGSGAGSGSGDDPNGTGTCLGLGCGAAVAIPTPPPVPAVVQPVVVPPTVIKGLRIAGDTQVQPPAPTRTAIVRDGRSRVTASFRVCVGTSGQVTSSTTVKSSGYADYDGALTAALQTWRYRPYQVGGKAVPVCGVVTFVYSIH